MISLEMIHYKENRITGSIESPISAWTDTAKEIPDEATISSTLEAELAESKSPNLVQACLNVWLGDEENWQRELLKSVALEASQLKGEPK